MEGKIRTIKSYGRTVAKTLSEHQRQDLENYIMENRFEEFKKLYTSFILEIGFGNGLNIIKLSKDYPDFGIVGVEPFKNSCIKLIRDIRTQSIKNIFVFNDDVKNLVETINDKFFSKVYILFPDPWPKKKHNKRRLVNEDFFRWLVLKTREEIVFATDNEDYFSSVLEFAGRYASVRIENDDDVIANTRYRQKALEAGRRCQCAVFYNFL